VITTIPFAYGPRGSGPRERPPDARMSLHAIDPQWSHYGPYLRQLVNTVQARWDRLAQERNITQLTGKSVSVTFQLDAKGAVSIASVSSSTGTPFAASVACVRAINARAPYAAWSDEMTAALGDEQTLTLTFNYQ